MNELSDRAKALLAELNRGTPAPEVEPVESFQILDALDYPDWLHSNGLEVAHDQPSGITPPHN